MCIGVCSQLHAECGAAFTSKLDGMFRDIELSKELREAYRQFAQNQSDASSSSSSLSSPSSCSSSSSRSSAASSAADLLEAQVLTQGVWPPYADAVGGGGELPVPVEVVRAQEAFKKFYLSKHTGMRRVVGVGSWGSSWMGGEIVCH
jgi:cullin-4